MKDLKRLFSRKQKYDHTQQRVENATGVDLDKIDDFLQEINSESEGFKMSELAEKFEKEFSARELAVIAAFTLRPHHNANGMIENITQKLKSMFGSEDAEVHVEAISIDDLPPAVRQRFEEHAHEQGMVIEKIEKPKPDTDGVIKLSGEGGSC